MDQPIFNRVASLDILRGVVMVLMALDHARDYFHIGAFGSNDPTNLDTTTPFLFFTRIITHYCAPVFVFLAGTSAFLYGVKTSKSTLSRFLFTRGLWLIFVEIVIMNLVWWFDVTYGFIMLQVIWAIGLSMVLLSMLIYLPKKILLIFSLLVIVLHNTLDPVTMEGNSFFAMLWYVLHQSEWLQISKDLIIVTGYPIIPWFAVMSLGYCFGELYKFDFPGEKRRKLLLYAGFSAIGLFVILRAINIYGDSAPWESQKNVAFTIMSFFNVTKYPPSLLYLLMTLGPAMLFLYCIENAKGAVYRFFTVFGRVPFFYYVLHVLLLHLMAILGLIILGKDYKIMIINNETAKLLENYGYPLGVAYLMWIVAVLILYPLCKKYMEYKARNKGKWWLSYL